MTLQMIVDYFKLYNVQIRDQAHLNEVCMYQAKFEDEFVSKLNKDLQEDFYNFKHDLFFRKSLDNERLIDILIFGIKLGLELKKN